MKAIIEDIEWAETDNCFQIEGLVNGELKTTSVSDNELLAFIHDESLNVDEIYISEDERQSTVKPYSVVKAEDYLVNEIDTLIPLYFKSLFK